MIFISSYQNDSNGFIEIEEDVQSTIEPSIKRNVKTHQALNGEIVYEDRGLTFLSSTFQIVSKDLYSLEDYFYIRNFIEKYSVFVISLRSGRYEAYDVTLTYNKDKINLKGFVSKSIS